MSARPTPAWSLGAAMAAGATASAAARTASSASRRDRFTRPEARPSRALARRVRSAGGPRPAAVRVRRVGERPVVIVTGASSGIGEAVAKHIARSRGARVVLVARREDRLEQLAAEIGGDASHVAVDVTAADGPQRILDHV